MPAVTLPARWPIVQIPNGTPGTVYCEIHGFSGYAVGSDCSIWTKKISGSRSYRLAESWRQRRLQVNTEGYYSVDLWREGKRHHKLLHVLLAHCFIGPPSAGQEVRHLNGVRLDCAIDNLAWGTRAQNVDDSRRHDTMSRGERHASSRLTESDVHRIRELRAAGMGARRIARLIGFPESRIAHVLNGATWKWLASVHDFQGDLRRKLTVATVSQIRQRHQAGERQASIARSLKIDPRTVSDIINRKRWRWLT